jgi:hypothetical protein
LIKEELVRDELNLMNSLDYPLTNTETKIGRDKEEL